MSELALPRRCRCSNWVTCFQTEMTNSNFQLQQARRWFVSAAPRANQRSRYWIRSCVAEPLRKAALLLSSGRCTRPCYVEFCVPVNVLTPSPLRILRRILEFWTPHPPRSLKYKSSEFMSSHSDIKDKSVHSTWYFRTWKRRKNDKTEGGKYAIRDLLIIYMSLKINKRVYANIAYKYKPILINQPTISSKAFQIQLWGVLR